MSAVSFSADLDRFGPQKTAARAISLADARAYCRRLAQTHYENFSVASFLLPRKLRAPFYSIYAYCRWADDLADEVGDASRSESLLDWWEEQLSACYGGESRHPVFVALSETIRRFEIPPDPFRDLLIAFRQDQRVTRYETVADLVGYCVHSANPVGRLILYLGRCCTPERIALSDSICTGLQWANFCQDVARDFQNGRIYLPRETWRAAGCDENALGGPAATESVRAGLRQEVNRAEQFLRGGEELSRLMPNELRLQTALFVEGGLAILRKIRELDYDVLSRRPTVTRADQWKILWQCCWGIRRRSTTCRKGPA